MIYISTMPSMMFHNALHVPYVLFSSFPWPWEVVELTRGVGSQITYFRRGGLRFRAPGPHGSLARGSSGPLGPPRPPRTEPRAPKTGPRLPKSDPRPPQDPPGATQDPLRPPQEPPRPAQEASRATQEPLGAVLDRKNAPKSSPAVGIRENDEDAFLHELGSTWPPKWQKTTPR